MVALADVCAHHDALQYHRQGHGYQQRAHTNRCQGGAKELDKSRPKVELPTQNGRRPAVVHDVAGGREFLRRQNVGSVVADPHLGVGAADEFTDE
jgi:hypothetical protein